MKIIVFFLVSVLLISCAVREKIVRIEPLPGEADSISYELQVTEPGFDTWLATNREPIWYHSPDYYKHFNHLYVNEWNNRVRTSGNEVPFDFLIDYNYRIDYGVDLEYELFWYFKFIQQKYDVKLLVTERP